MAEVSAPKLIIAAGISGLIAAGAVMMYLNSVESKYKKASQPVPEEMVNVVVPRKNMARGDRLDRKSLAARKIPLKYAPTDVMLASDISKIADRTLLTNIKYGRPIVWQAVTSTKSRTFSDVVEIGRRALTIKIRNVDTSGGLLRPGDKIDLMGTFQLGDLGIGQSGPISDDAVMPVLEGVEVMEAARVDKNGRRYENRNDKSSKDGIGFDFTLITLNLSSRQIARVELAETTGTVFAVLRNREDTSYAGYEYLGIDFLLTPDEPEDIDIVMGADGKPVGNIIGDKIVDKDGNVVGKVVDGKAVGLNGKELGTITRGVSADDPIMRVASVADVVRDDTGKIIGRIVDGKVVDRAGNVVGQIVDGKAVSMTGESLGKVSQGVALDADGNEVDLSDTEAEQDLVFDDSGRPVGRVVGTQVLDSKGRVIGKIVDGKPVTMNGEPMGKVVRGVSAGDPISQVAEVVDVVRDANGKVVGKIERVVRDESGNIVGRVVNGKVVDASGNVIGKVDENGNPVDLSGASLGVVDQKVIDSDGNVIGQVVDGQAVSITGETLGTVDKDVALDANGEEVDLSSSSASTRPARIEKVVRDASGNVVGRVVDGQVVDESGKVVGKIERVVRDESGNIVGRIVDGKVVDESGNVIGKVDKNGNPVDLSGASLGVVDEQVIDSDGTVIGEVEEALVNEAGMIVGKPAEVIRNAKGEIIGRVKDGKVVDENGKVIGKVDKNGNAVANNGKTLGKIEKVMLDNDGEIISGALVEDSVSVVRDENGEIIGKLVDGKVVNAAGEVVGTLKDGQVISNTGEILASDVSIGTASEQEVVAATTMDSSAPSRRAQIIDFIPGGTAKDGITPVVKVRAQ